MRQGLDPLCSHSEPFMPPPVFRFFLRVVWFLWALALALTALPDLPAGVTRAPQAPGGLIMATPPKGGGPGLGAKRFGGRAGGPEGGPNSSEARPVGGG
eukprot:5547741-Pyramimonas_sp.AAC.1